jgi:hypothetical protein
MAESSSLGVALKKVEGWNDEFVEATVTLWDFEGLPTLEGKGQSRRPVSALAYALEDLAQKLKEKT